MRALLMTGMAGFIGINILNKMDFSILSKTFNKIVSIDKMGYATTYNKDEYYDICNKNNIHMINCDINKLEPIEEFKKYEWDLLDLSSESHVDNAINAPSDIFCENSILSASLYKFLTGCKINQWFHITTDETAGELPLNSTPDDWFSINSPIKPNNPYSASKAAQLCFLMSLKHTFGVDIKFVRLANQFGPKQHPEKMLPASILRVIRGEPIKIYGSGLNKRQWTPVDITADIINLLIRSCPCWHSSDMVQIANSKGVYNNIEIVYKLVRVMEEFGFSPTIQFVTDRKGHDLMYALKTNSFVDEFFNDVDIHKELYKTVEYYIQNKERYLK